MHFKSEKDFNFWLDKAYRDGATTEDIVSKLLEWSKEDNGVVPDYVVEFIRKYQS